MKVGLKRHPVMKDSGVVWLGKIPAHWKIDRFKYLLAERDARSASGVEDLLRVSQYTGITKRKRGDAGHQHSRAESLVGYKRVDPGDLVINIMLAWNGSLGVSPFEGIVSPAYCVYRFDGHSEPRYYHYLLRSPVYRARIKAVSTGVVESRLRLYTDDLCRLRAVSPPLREQSAIVRFLDHSDWRIRRYIRAKERLIELLEEQRQAIIRQAVTGQIDVRTGQSYPAYKDSGVEWLGEVPEHWEVARLKSVLERPMRNGLFKKKDRFGRGVPLVNVADVYGDEFQVDPDTLERVEASLEELRRFRVRSGDILFVRSSLKLEGTGRSAVALGCSVDTVFECHLVQARPATARVSPRYLVIQLNSSAIRHYLISRANVVTMATVAQNTVTSCPLLVPPPAEQREIVRWVDHHLSRSRVAVARIERQVELLSAYRTRLCADVVTGKLDVREAAGSVPEVALLPAAYRPVEPESSTGGQAGGPQDTLHPPHP